MSLANARTVCRLVALETYNYDKKEKLVYDQAGYTGNSFPPPPGPQVIFPQQNFIHFFENVTLSHLFGVRSKMIFFSIRWQA